MNFQLLEKKHYNVEYEAFKHKHTQVTIHIMWLLAELI